ncbi:Hypothetical predicted protein [Mytilus galloprovincialis]|uniref:Uncharacterized protein n=1 Tax=Mytilus galloprovincialis TaxID=29158 RepID=A0A8B6ETC4_MYTGA|nr:Hypothetical predicted protein [Mytilus galloprovincialis]
MIKPTNGFSLQQIRNADDSDEHSELLRAVFYSNRSIDIFCNANSVYFESLLLTCQERAQQEPVTESGNITDIVQEIGKITRNVTIILSGRTQYKTVLDNLKQMLLRLRGTFHVNLGPILNVHGSDYHYNSQRDVPIILSHLGKIQRLLNTISHRI